MRWLVRFARFTDVRRPLAARLPVHIHSRFVFTRGHLDIIRPRIVDLSVWAATRIGAIYGYSVGAWRLPSFCRSVLSEIPLFSGHTLEFVAACVRASVVAHRVCCARQSLATCRSSGNIGNAAAGSDGLYS